MKNFKFMCYNQLYPWISNFLYPKQIYLLIHLSMNFLKYCHIYVIIFNIMCYI